MPALLLISRRTNIRRSKKEEGGMELTGSATCREFQRANDLKLLTRIAMEGFSLCAQIKN
jgi:hypothetical protein